MNSQPQFEKLVDFSCCYIVANITEPMGKDLQQPGRSAAKPPAILLVCYIIPVFFLAVLTSTDHTRGGHNLLQNVSCAAFFKEFLRIGIIFGPP
jgi:hypothetical protein